MMSVIAKITDPALFENKVAEVNTEKLALGDDECYTGQLCITNNAGIIRPYFGLIEPDEFESEYGFQLVTSNPKKIILRATENPVTE